MAAPGSRVSFRPSLKKLFADRRASVPVDAIRARVRAEIAKVFRAGEGVESASSSERTNQVRERAALTRVVLAPENSAGETATWKLMEGMANDLGSSARTYKRAVI